MASTLLDRCAKRFSTGVEAEPSEDVSCTDARHAKLIPMPWRGVF